MTDLLHDNFVAVFFQFYGKHMTANNSLGTMATGVKAGINVKTEVMKFL